MGFLSGLFGGGSKKQSTYTTTSAESNETASKQNFSSPETQRMYQSFLGATQNNYNKINDLNNTLLNNYLDGNGIGDTSNFYTGWNNALGIDQSNIKKMNSQDLNPYNDQVTRNYIDASNKAAYLANGKNYNQAMQNMIGSGMANGSGHQTAMAKVGAQLAANINAQNQQTYLARQNQLEQNALAANGQLANFYNTLSNIGLDYAKLSQQDLATLLSAYNQQNEALNTYRSAVELGSDPTMTTSGRQYGTSNSDTTQTGSGANLLGALAGFFLK